MKHLLIICSCISITFCTLKSQINTTPDKIYEQKDTIRKIVEVVRYEYYDAPPLQLFIGTGIDFSRAKFSSDHINTTITQPGLPISLRLQKENIYIHTGLKYQNLSLTIPVSKTIEEQVAHTVTQTIVVDTFYRYNNGDPIETVVTKDVESVEYELVKIDTTYNKKRDYKTLLFPLLLGYRKTFNKVSVKADAGMSLLLFTKYSQDDVKEDFSGCDYHFFTYTIGAGVEFALSDRLNIDCGVHVNKKTNGQYFDFLQQNLEFQLFYKIF